MSTKRLNLIKNYLMQNKKVYVSRLSEMLLVTQTTIRSDLDKLESEGFVMRFHGGAIWRENRLYDFSSFDESASLTTEKSYIANVAADIICNGDVVFLGEGLTCWQIAKKIKNKQNISVVTNNVHVLHELYEINTINLTITGGNVRKTGESFFLSGPFSLHALDKIIVDKAFISPLGVSITNGYTIDSEDQLEFYNTMKKVANEIIILADHTKFDKTHLISFLPIDAVTKIITDGKIPNLFQKFYNENSIIIYN